MLSIGAAVLGAGHVLAVDIDEGALDLCQQNLADLDCSTVCKGTLSFGLTGPGNYVACRDCRLSMPTHAWHTLQACSLCFTACWIYACCWIRDI